MRRSQLMEVPLYLERVLDDLTKYNYYFMKLSFRI
jgi:hypothetical protein